MKMKKLLLWAPLLSLMGGSAHAATFINKTELPIRFEIIRIDWRGNKSDSHVELGTNSKLSVPLIKMLQDLKDQTPSNKDSRGVVRFSANQSTQIEGEPLKTYVTCANDLPITPEMKDVDLQNKDNALTITLEPDLQNPNKVGKCRVE